MPLYEHVAIDFHWAPDPVIVAERLREGARHLEDMAPPLNLSAQAAQRSVQRRFDTETDPDDNPWTPWSSKYEAWRNQHHPGKILNLSGDLEAAATSFSMYRFTDNSVFYEGDLPSYGWAHQEGSSRSRWGKEAESEMRSAGFDPLGNELPARPFAGIDDQAGDEIYTIFDAWVAQSVNITFQPSGRAVARIPKGQPGAGRFVRV